MIRFDTESGSRYEIDGKRIRRIAGVFSPTKRLRPEGSWKEFSSTTTPRVGRAVFILWPDDDKATITTRITKLETV